jgi:hypothetical protein
MANFVRKPIEAQKHIQNIVFNQKIKKKLMQPLIPTVVGTVTTSIDPGTIFFFPQSRELRLTPSIPNYGILAFPDTIAFDMHFDIHSLWIYS